MLDPFVIRYIKRIKYAKIVILMIFIIIEKHVVCKILLFNVNHLYRNYNHYETMSNYCYNVISSIFTIIYIENNFINISFTSSSCSYSC